MGACKGKGEAEAENEQHLCSLHCNTWSPCPCLHSHKFPKGGTVAVLFTFVLPEHSAASEALGNYFQSE